MSQGPCSLGLCRNAPHPCEAIALRLRLQPARRAGIATLATPAHTPPTHQSYRSSGSYGGGGSGGGGSSGGRRSGRTRAGGSVTYSPTEWRSIEPVARKAAEQAVSHPELRDLFLCHAWDDRESSAAELFTSLESSGTSVWFSEKDVPLGTLLIREIDKGLRNSRIGIVLVTPALLKSIEQEGIAEKELSARLATDRVIPVAHGTTFEALREVSPLLASRSGLSTADSSLAEVATKVAAAAAALGDFDT